MDNAETGLLLQRFVTQIRKCSWRMAFFFIVVGRFPSSSLLTPVNFSASACLNQCKNSTVLLGWTSNYNSNKS